MRHLDACLYTQELVAIVNRTRAAIDEFSALINSYLCCSIGVKLDDITTEEMGFASPLERVPRLAPLKRSMMTLLKLLLESGSSTPSGMLVTEQSWEAFAGDSSWKNCKSSAPKTANPQ